MGLFVVISFYHLGLGLQQILDDYVHAPGMKLFLRLVVTVVWIIASVIAVFALVRIAAL
jgi:succinate dehydrogenase / fumarate reductase membrane anchor subunit